MGLVPGPGHKSNRLAQRVAVRPVKEPSPRSYEQTRAESRQGWLLQSSRVTSSPLWLLPWPQRENCTEAVLTRGLSLAEKQIPPSRGPLALIRGRSVPITKLWASSSWEEKGTWIQPSWEPLSRRYLGSQTSRPICTTPSPQETLSLPSSRARALGPEPARPPGHRWDGPQADGRGFRRADTASRRESTAPGPECLGPEPDCVSTNIKDF